MLNNNLDKSPLINPSVNHEQKRLFNNFDRYLEIRSEKRADRNDAEVKLEYAFPFGTKYALCSGLVEYWLYFKRQNLERRFIKQVEYVATWDANNFAESVALDDSYLDSLMQIVRFLHNDVMRREVLKDSPSTSINFLSTDFEYHGTTQEFALTFVFSRAKLFEFVRDNFHPNKMIRIDNGLHPVGVIDIGGDFYFYDPDAKAGPQKLNDAQQVAGQIFSALSPWCRSKKYIALRITISDLKASVAAQYPAVLEYCTSALKDPVYKNAVIKHPNIFHLAAEYNDYQLIDLLYANGYKYIPWKLNADTELNEAVVLNDPYEIEYLLNHNVPINYRTRKGITPFGKTIVLNAPQLMYQLYNAGADLSLQPINGFSPVEVAIMYKSAEALILLLALGADITPDQVLKMFKIFGDSTSHKIMARALDLNKMLLNAPGELDLNTATGRDVVAFLQHKAVANKLGYQISQIKVRNNGLPVVGHLALQAIDNYYQTSPDTDMFSFPEKVEMYRLLQQFDVDLFDFDGTQHLLELIKNVKNTVISKPLADYSTIELVEIEKILDELTDLSSNFWSLDLNKIYISIKAAGAKRAIIAYLRRNGINSLAKHLKQLNHPVALINSPQFFAVQRRDEPEGLSYQADIASKLHL